MGKEQQSIMIKVTKEEEARLVTSCKWPYGSTRWSDSICEIPSAHRKFHWYNQNPSIEKIVLKPPDNDWLYFRLCNNHPYISPKDREIVYYTGDAPNAEGIYYAPPLRRYITDAKRPDIERIRAKYQNPDAVEAFHKEENEILERKRRNEEFFQQRIPEKYLIGSKLIPDFDAEAVANKKIEKHILVFEAIYDLLSINILHSGMILGKMYRTIQFNISRHGIDISNTTIRDVIRDRGDLIDNKIKRGAAVDIPEVCQDFSY